MADIDDVLLDTGERMEKSVAALERELGSVRTGRASPALVENLLVFCVADAQPAVSP